MKRPRRTPLSDKRRALVLSAIILLQGLTAVFFVGDIVYDLILFGRIEGLHLWLEAFAAVALCGGVVFLMLELRRLLERVAVLDRGLRAARGEMAEVIEAFFTDWGLTPAERDVALMVLKGVDNDTIARLRGTAPGTVRAQCTSVYTKAGVDGRAQLISLFMEELLAAEREDGPGE